MARSGKRGVDYLPLDVHMNDKMRFVELRFGLKGFAVVVKLWMRIYDNGYYCEWNEDVALMFAGENRAGVNAVSEILSEAIKRGIFDKRLYEKYGILTSQGIQQRYLEMTSRRKRVDFKKEYLLIDIPKNAENVYINGINVNINPQNDNINSQSKVKESKVKESKVNESKVGGASANASAAGAAADTDIQTKSDIDKVTKHYRDRIGYGFVKEQTDCVQKWLDNNVEAEMINAAIDEAVSAGVKKFSYVKAIVEDRINRGIKSLNAFNMQKKAYERRKTERDQHQIWGVRKTRFNNYTDTNKTDYAEIERIISSPEYLDMLIEDMSKGKK